MAGPGSDARLKVFVSYSRKDEAFANELVAGLELTGFEPLLDTHDIAAGEDWATRLGRLIESADTTVFVISPDSVASDRCAWEVERTLALKKRLMPIVWRMVDDAQVPEGLKRLNYIFFDKAHSFAKSLSVLTTALNTDVEWIRRHTQLGESALRWDAGGRREAFLIRGEDLADARQWLRNQPRYAPEPSELTRLFISASEEAEAALANTERARLEAIATAQAAREEALKGQEAALERARLAQRQRARIGGIAALALMIVAAVAVWQANEAGTQSRRALKEAETAERRLQIARETSSSLVSLITDDLRKALGIRTKTLERILDAARGSFDRLETALRDDPAFQDERARMMSGFGEAYRKAGDHGKSELAYRDSLKIYMQLHLVEPTHLEWRRGIADQIDNIGVLAMTNGKLDEARELFDEALQMRQLVATLDPESWITQRDLASSNYNLGEVMRDSRKNKEALQHFEASEALARKALETTTDRAIANEINLKLSLINVSLSTVYRIEGRKDDVRRLNRSSLAIRKALSEFDPENAEYKRLLSWAYSWVGNDLEEDGNWQGALEQYRECLSVRRDLHQADPTSQQARYDLAWGLHYTGNALRALKRFGEASEHLADATRHRVVLVRNDASVLRWRKDLGLSHIALADIALDRGQSAQALEHFHDARKEFEDLMPYPQIPADWKLTLSRVYNQIARIAKLGGDLATAHENYSRSLDLRRGLHDGRPANVDAMASLATSLFLVGEVRMLRGDAEGARPLLEESEALRRRVLATRTNDSTAQRELDQVTAMIASLSTSRDGR